MTTETILSHDQIRAVIDDAGPDNYFGLSRAIEQAVLQSEQVKAWKKDAARYRATRAGLVGTDPDYGNRFCAYCDAEGIEQSVEITEGQFDAATDAAMEQQ